MKTGVHLLVDYFSATFPFICYDDDSELILLEEIKIIIASFMGFTEEDIVKEDYSQNRFKQQFTIGNNITLRLLGPELKSGHRSCSIELKGEGCREFEVVSNRSWQELFEFFIVRLNASPTRIDLAIDDYEGSQVDINWIKDKLDKQQYNTSFKKKYYKLYGCDEEGWSINFGSHQSTQMLVIYEKHKEQLAKDKLCLQKYWLRFEMRFFHDKAYNIAMNLIDNDFKSYTFGLLLNLLDIKEDNNKDDNHQYEVATNTKWLEFVNSSSKAKIEKYKLKNDSYQRYLAWVSPHIGFYFINLMINCNNDFNYALFVLCQTGVKFLKTIDDRHLRKINKFRKEQNQNKIIREDIGELRKLLDSIVKDRKILIP